MRKGKGASSSNAMPRRRKHIQDYLEGTHHIVTPNQRSLPKYKNVFGPVRREKSGKKNQGIKRNSQGKAERKEKENHSPHPNRSQQKYNRWEGSMYRQYDSPSRDQEEIDFIVKGVHKKVKGNSFIENTIEKVNIHLQQNRLSDAIFVLQEALQKQPNHMDLQHLLAISYIFNAEYEHAVVILEEMMRKKPKKNLYLLLSVCYKKTQYYTETEEILNRCIRNYPKYYEAYIYRGKLYLKLKQYKQAMADFDKAIGLDGSKQIALVGKGDCLRLMERYDEAKNYYTTAYNHKKSNISLLLRRAICNMEIKRYEAALEDINHLLEADFQNSEAHYFKGLIFNKLKQPNDSIICYEQAIKHNSNKRAVTRAIYEITKIKIENRDYYEALFTLERAEYLDIDEKVVKKFRIFINGVTSMMKKNYKEGIKILTELQQDKEKPISSFLKPLFYSTRSYGYMSLQMYQNAKEDLEAMENQFSLDLPNLYNKFICQGIIACNNQKYEDALKLFSKAAKAQPKRLQPHYYKALTLIIFSVKLLPKEMKDKKKNYLESAMKTITKQQKGQLKKIQNNPSLFMIRGLLQYALGDLDEALKDFDQCLNQSTKPNPMVFYLIGLIFSETGKYSEAIGQFKRAIEHDEKNLIPEAYLSRAKCMILSDEINTGFIDLQTYMTKKNTPQIHIWAGHLLFYIRAYEDANRAYSNINNINKNFDVLFYKVKCYLIIKDVLNALNYLKMMLDLRQDPKTLFDYDILDCLRQCSEQNFQDYPNILKKMKQAKQKSKGQFGSIIEQYNYQFYKGVMYFYCQDYGNARKNFQRSLSLIENYFDGSVALNHNDEQFFSEFNSLSFSNLSFNYHEIQYNITVCHILEGNYSLAHKSLMKVVESLPSGQIKQEYSKIMALLMEMVQNPNVDTNEEEEVQIMPFPIQNRLCSIFPEIQLPLAINVRTRIFFCLPHVRKPDITPKFEEKILEEFSITSIEIKPEAPWIRKSEEGVIFTDEVIKYDIELSQSSSSEDKSSEEDEEQYVANAEELFEENKIHARKQISDEDNYGHDEFEEEEQPAPKMTGNQLREFFKLDKQTEERLGKIRNN